MTGKTNLCNAVREYHTIIKLLPQVNQFGEELEVLAILTMMRKYPKLLSDYFMEKEKKPSTNSLAVEGLDPEKIGIEEVLVSKEAEFFYRITYP